MQVPDIKICVITHKDYWMPSDEVYVPLHVGKAEHPEVDLGFTADDTGDNISDRNSRYCELTGIYWAWKNLEADYLGFCQYRRHFMYKEKVKRGDASNVMTTGEAIAACLQAQVIVPKTRNYRIQTLEQHFLGYSFAYPDDLEALRSSINVIDPTYLPAFDKVMSRRKGHMCNMWIMRRDLADSYCSWLFDVMSDLDNRIDPSRTRILGYFAEHMLDIWMEKHGINDYLELDSVFFDRDNEWRKRVGYLLRIVGAKEASERFVKRQK